MDWYNVGYKKIMEELGAKFDLMNLGTSVCNPTNDFSVTKKHYDQGQLISTNNFPEELKKIINMLEAK
jgi:hypothetical protein